MTLTSTHLREWMLYQTKNAGLLARPAHTTRDRPREDCFLQS